MKRLLRPLLLLVAMTALLSVSVFADSGTGTGFFDIDIGKTDGVTVTPDGDGRLNVIWDSSTEGPTSALYQNSEKLTVKLTGAQTGCWYFILLTTGNSVNPTESDIFYVDQVTATGSTVTFSVLPMLGLADEGKTQGANIFITSNAPGFDTKKIPLGYANNAAYVEPLYTLGDVDSDGNVLAKDAMFVLQYSVDIETDFDDMIPLAGDVDGDKQILAKDAMFILQYSVGSLTKWPVEE